jgi:hypothetical protein
VRGWMLRQAQHERQKACPEEFRGPETEEGLQIRIWAIYNNRFDYWEESG